MHMRSFAKANELPPCIPPICRFWVIEIVPQGYAAHHHEGRSILGNISGLLPAAQAWHREPFRQVSEAESPSSHVSAGGRHRVRVLTSLFGRLTGVQLNFVSGFLAGTLPLDNATLLA